MQDTTTVTLDASNRSNGAFLPVKSALAASGGFMGALFDLAGDGFVMRDYRPPIRATARVLAMLQQFSTGDDV